MGFPLELAIEKGFPWEEAGTDGKAYQTISRKSPKDSRKTTVSKLGPYGVPWDFHENLRLRKYFPQEPAVTHGNPLLRDNPHGTPW